MIPKKRVTIFSLENINNVGDLILGDTTEFF